MQGDKIISALIGLVGACESNPRTEHTDKVVFQALASLDGDEREMIDAIYAEKFAVAPGCAQCAMPCGNTSDYDMRRIYEASEEIQTLKLAILAELRAVAREVPLERLGESDRWLCYRALAYVSYDLERSELQSLLQELRDLGGNKHDP